jgi:hypothetical protein
METAGGKEQTGGGVSRVSKGQTNAQEDVNAIISSIEKLFTAS